MKKLLSLILVLCMLLSMSITAFATEGEATATETPILVIGPTAPETIPAEAPVATLQEAVNAAVTPSDGAATIDPIVSDPNNNNNEGPADIGGAVIKDDVTIQLFDNDVIISNPSVGSPDTETLGMQLLEQPDDNTDTPISIIGGGGSITFTDNNNPDIKMGIQNYTDLVLDSVTINGEDLAGSNPNYVVSNNSGSLLVTNGASIIAGEDDVAFDVYVYAPYYPDAPDVTISETAGTIDGIIEFDGTDEAAETITNTEGASEPSLTIEGGTFENFVLRIGKAVANFVNNISITGGNFDSTTVEGQDADGNAYKFEDFVPETHEVIFEGGRYWVKAIVQVTPDAPPVEVYVPVEPEYVPAPAPAPQPAAPAPVVVAPAAPVAVEVNGTTVELTVVAEDIKAEAVAPVKEGKAAELKVTVAPTVLAVEGAKAEEVVEALVATATVSVKEGDTLAAKDYQITMSADGELKVELSAEYLKTLGVGEHIIVLNIGGIEIEFTIVIK